MHPFKIGDKVFIVRKITNEVAHAPYWLAPMETWMNDYLNTYTVIEIAGAGNAACRVQKEGGGSWYFHHESLAFAGAKQLKEGEAFVIFRRVEAAQYPEAVYWNPRMDKLIGETRKVERIIEDVRKGHRFKTARCEETGFSWEFDWRCVKPVIEKEIEMLKKVIAKKKAVKKVKPKSLALILKKAVDNKFSRCHFAIRFKEGDDKVEAIAPCHAQFGRRYEREYQGAIVTQAVEHIEENLNHLQKYQNTNEKKAQTKRYFYTYVKWILNDSPWASCFITKSVAHAFRYGVYYNVEMNHASLLSAAVALRVGSEYPDILKQFNEHLSEGKEGVVAWILANVYDASTGKRRPLDGGHHTIVSTQDVVQFFNFFRDGTWNPKCVNTKMPFAEGDNYSICDAIADQRTKKKTLVQWLNKQCPAFAAVGGWGVVGEKATPQQIKALVDAIKKKLKIQ